LKVHAEDRRDARAARAVVTAAMDLVEDPLDLELIIARRANNAESGVRTIDVRDFRRIEIFHAISRGAVDQVVGGGLGGPGGWLACRSRDLEDRVSAQRFVRKQRNAVAVDAVAR